jgi:hypothetical protein
MEKHSTPENQTEYPKRIFASQLITLEDLQRFQKEFFEKLETSLQQLKNITPKKWMKSHEVRRMLKISPGTLQSLKSDGTLPYSKVGGIHFYDYEDIQRLLEKSKGQ